MRILLLYYSRKGATRALMEEVAAALGNGDLFCLEPEQGYRGPVGTAALAAKTLLGGTVRLKPLDTPIPVFQYDLAVLGTPVYAGKVSAPMRSFLQQNGRTLQRTAHVIIHSRPAPYDGVLSEMDSLTGQRRCAALDVSKGAQNKTDMVRAFASALRV